LCQALQLGLEDDGMSTVAAGSDAPMSFRLPAQEVSRADTSIVAGPRVGLSKGAELAYRFYLEPCPWVSPWRRGGAKRRPASR
jgi:3-methyladenine DNA glycosylase Mpg